MEEAPFSLLLLILLLFLLLLLRVPLQRSCQVSSNLVPTNP